MPTADEVDRIYAELHDYPFRVEIGIPWRSSADRLPAFQETLGWWQTRSFSPVLMDSSHAAFNLAAVRNALVARLAPHADVIILCDADTVPEDAALRAAVLAAAKDARVHLPYHLYQLDTGEFVDGAYSGVYVFRAEAWDATNGQDEAFQGWGYEDNAWRLAHLTLNGPIERHAGTVFAASHRDAPRDRVPLNRARYRLYQDAYGKPELMRILVAGGTTESPDRQARVRNSNLPHGYLRPLR